MTADPGPGRAVRARPSGWTIGWSVLVWFALWGGASPVLALTGVLVGLFAVWVFPLPAIDFRLRWRPIPGVVLIVRFLADVAVASFQVAWLAVRRRPPRSGMITVQLTTESDVIQALTATAVSLVPGSLVVEADPVLRTLTIHVLDAAPDGFTAAYRSALDQEGRIMRALGQTPSIRPDNDEGRK